MTKEYAEYLAHYGVPHMKKGVRRWQNEDGSYTPEGRIHYGIGDSEPRIAKAEENKRYDGFTPRQKTYYDKLTDKQKKSLNKQLDKGRSFTRSKEIMVKREQKANLLKALGIIGLGAAGSYAIGYYGSLGITKVGMKVAKVVSNKMKTSQKWHNLLNRVKARRTGSIVLGRKDYTISGGWLNGARR